MSRPVAIVIACVIGVGVVGAGAARADDTEQAAYERARPVFEKYCVKCHSRSGEKPDDQALEHLDMTTYPFGGHHAAMAGMAVREAVGATGEAPTMPDDAPGAVQGEELQAVLAWADAFDRAHPMAMGGDHDHDMDMHTDEGMHMDENMHDMPGMHEGPMNMAGPLGLGMSRTGSGTAWQPDATREGAHEVMRGGWMLMLHYALHAGYDRQGSDRGDDKPVGLGWVMGMASHELAGGELALRAMLSPEPITLGKRGYPLLLQTGEEVGGEPLHDRQHPHDLFMEVAARYAHPIGDDLAIEIYGGPAAEPALGPVAFAHRPYALYDMTAPLGHHWEDSTHVSFGVVTAGIYTRSVKLEGSWFNGREPDENRYDFDLGGLDSYAARLTVNPTAHWSMEMSYGYLAEPEATEPGVSVQRVVASATYASSGVDLIAVVGRNLPSEGHQTSAALVEASGPLCDHVVLFGRAELVEKTGADLVLAPADAERVFGMGSLGAGAVYELDLPRHVTLGLGARVTADLVDDLRSYYGTSTPAGFMIYAEAHPARAR